MSKLLKVIGLIVLSIMLVGGAYAGQDFIIWQKSAGEGFSTFKAVMKERGAEDESGTRVMAEELGFAAYDYAKENQLLSLVEPQFRTKEAYPKRFLEFNEIKSKWVLYSYFQSVGQGKIGWRLPVDDQTSPQVGALTKQLASLKKQMESGNQSTESINNKIAAIEAGLAEMAAGEIDDREAMATLVGEVMTAMSDLSNQISLLEASDKKQNSQIKGQLKLINANTESVNSQKGYNIAMFAGLLVTMVVLLLFGVWYWRTDHKKLQAVSAVVEHKEEGLTATRQVALEVKAGVTALSAEVESLTDSVSDFEFGLDWDLFKAKLAKLPVGRENAVNRVFTHKVTHKEYKVTYWRNHDTLEGLICTDVVRKSGIDLLADPFAIKKLGNKLADAVGSGRLPPQDQVMRAVK